LSAWLPSRLFRGSSDDLGADCDSDDPDRLHMAVASSWPDSAWLHRPRPRRSHTARARGRLRPQVARGL